MVTQNSLVPRTGRHFEYYTKSAALDDDDDDNGDGEERNNIVLRMMLLSHYGFGILKSCLDSTRARHALRFYVAFSQNR